nr:MAG TPA: hypothetical protein [Caudoviricetes sp.]
MGSHHNLQREAVATFKHSVIIWQKKKTIRNTRAPSISTLAEPQMVTRHGQKKPKKKDAICRLQ